MKRHRDDEGSDDESRVASDGGDGSDIDEDDGRVPGYDATKETLPQSKVFTPTFKEITMNIQNITGLLIEPITNTPYRNAVIAGLLEEIKRRTKGDYPEEVRVALVGAMKSGKSSVINSLLSAGIIARQGDPGRSCTWVVNEFRYLLPNQTKPFAADVHFFTQEERQDTIRGMVANYFRGSSKYDSESEEFSGQKQSSEDYNTQRDVVTACLALFKERQEFKSVAKAHAFLSTAEAEDDEAVVDKLLMWNEDRMAAVLMGAPCVRLEADTPGKLLMQLAPYQYTVNTHYGETSCSMWPLVNHIKFGLDCELLKNNLSLIDLPGLTDANKTRVQNANDHLRACTHEMIVADIARAEDDNFIRERFEGSFMLRGSERTILALTHGDDMDESTDFDGPPSDERALEKLGKEAEQLERRINEMTSRIKKGGPDKQQWKAAKKQLSKELDEKESAEVRFRLAVRSRDTGEEMRDVYADLTQDPAALPVFCVGNAAYKKHQAGYKKGKAPPRLSVEETQIPALRQHLFLAPAEGRLNEARHLVFTQLPVAIKCANLFVSKTHLARKDDIEKIVVAPQAMVYPIVDAVIDWFRSQAEELLLEPYRQADQAWSREARKLCDKWVKMHGTSMHLTFLKKDGIKKGRGKGAEVLSWNSELIDLRVEEIEQWFGNYIAQIPAAITKLLKTVNSYILKMIAEISADEQFTLMALKSFVDYVREEKANLKRCIEKPLKSLRKDLSNTFGSATSEEPMNQIVRAMVPIYDKAQQIKGKVHGGQKAPQNRVNFFAKHVSKQGDGVWMRSHDYLKKDIDKVLDKHGKDLKTDILRFFVGIDEKFQMMSADKSKETPEETEVREALQKNVLLVTEQYEKELLPVAEAFFEVRKSSLFVEE